MAHLIKLESGDYLNLDQLCYTDENRDHSYIDSEEPHAYMTDGGIVKLSPKDLEKIEKIANYQGLQTIEPEIVDKPWKLPKNEYDDWANR